MIEILPAWRKEAQEGQSKPSNLLRSNDRKYSKGRAKSFRVPGVAGHPTLSKEASALVSASLAKNTWQKYEAARNKLTKFAKSNSINIVWPLSKEVLRGFCTWAIKFEKLSVGSCKDYLSGLKFISCAQGYDTTNFSDEYLKKILTGAKNLESLKPKVKSTRRVMSVPLMLLTKSELEKTQWPVLQKSSFWACITIAFQASVRMGELTVSSASKFDPQSDLLCGDVVLNKGVFTLHIRSPKVSRVHGDYVEIFKTKDALCPHQALLEHINALAKHGCYIKKAPIMAVSVSSFLTVKKFNELLKSLLKEQIDLETHPVSAHSLRASVPSLAQSKGVDLNTKGWGRWSSSAVNRYQRLSWEQRALEFDKVKDLVSTKRFDC